VYEQAIHIPYYGIYEVEKASIEMYQLISGHYQLMRPNQYGQYEIPELDVAVGIWHGEYNYTTLPWLRWWDRQGNLLPTSEEQLRITEEQLRISDKQLRINEEQLQAERQAKELAQQELAQLRAKLRELGLD
jgi:hypothetical protein